MYLAFGDESRDESAKRVYAVAAVFGHQEDWDMIEIPWKQRLGGRVFHAAECEFGKGDFSDLGAGEGKKLYRDLTTLIVASRLCGHGVAINLEDYSESFPQDFGHGPYMWALGDVLQVMAEMANVAILPSRERVQVTFDRNDEIEHNATAIYNLMRHSKRIEARRSLADTISFASRRSVGIQIADLFARETMKYFDLHISRSKLPTRGSFTALHNTKRFAFLIVGKRDFERKKLELDDKHIPGATVAEYQQWLAENRLHDCLSNRIEHLRHIPEVWDDTKL